MHIAAVDMANVNKPPNTWSFKVDFVLTAHNLPLKKIEKHIMPQPLQRNEAAFLLYATRSALATTVANLNSTKSALATTVANPNLTKRTLATTVANQNLTKSTLATTVANLLQTKEHIKLYL